MQTRRKHLPHTCLALLACAWCASARAQPILGFEHYAYPLTGQPDPGLVIPGPAPGVAYDFSDPVTDVNDLGQQVVQTPEGDQVKIERIDPGGASTTVRFIGMNGDLTQINDRQLLNNRGVVAYWAHYEYDNPSRHGELFYLNETEPAAIPQRILVSVADDQTSVYNIFNATGYQLRGLDDNSLHLNNHNHVAFTGTVRGDSGGDLKAVFARYYQDNLLFMVARNGQIIDLNSDPVAEDLQTIKSVDQLIGINDDYMVGYRVTLENDEQAIVVSQIIVPEPSSACALIAGIGMIGRRRRR